MSKRERRLFICDGKRPDNEVMQEAVDWVDADPSNRRATIRPSGRTQ